MSNIEKLPICLERMKDAADENRPTSVAFYGHQATAFALMAVHHEVWTLVEEIQGLRKELLARRPGE